MALTRRTALALSGVVAGTVAAASLAGALVIGGADGADPTPPDPIAVVDATAGAPGTASAPTTAPDVEIVYQDVYDLPPATAPAGAGVVGSSPAPTAPAVAGDLSAAVAGDDDQWDDDEYEYDEHDEYEYEDDDEYEDHDDEGEWDDD